MHQLRNILLAILILAVPLAYARDLAIIVEKSNGTSAMTSAQLEKMLKASVQSWPDGKRVKIFLPDPGSADFKTLLQRVYKMTPDEMKHYADSHKADIQLAGSDDVVMTLVANNPGSIGVVNVYSISSKIKVVKIDDKLPLEQGYLLHGN